MDTSQNRLDLLGPATATAWLILANKPIYPLYVWWFAGQGTLASTATMLSAPLYAGVIALGRVSSLGARVTLPLVGAADTLFATKLFGAQSATELFLTPCALLAVLGFGAGEERWSRGLSVALAAAFAATHGRLGAPLHVWPDSALASLADVNAYAVAGLSLFIAWRFR